MSFVVRYVEAYMQRFCANTLGDSDFLNLLGGDGGSHVDVVLYVLYRGEKPLAGQESHALTAP